MSSSWKQWLFGKKASRQQMLGFDIVVATDQEGGIGNTTLDGVEYIPWRIPSELRFFKSLTTIGNNAVIMGRNTWDSLPKKAQPLPNRINIVISRTMSANNDLATTPLVFKSLDDSLRFLRKLDVTTMRIDNVFVIGGAMLYETALEHPMCRQVYKTLIQDKYNCDKEFPTINLDKFYLLTESKPIQQNTNEPTYTIQRYAKKPNH